MIRRMPSMAMRGIRKGRPVTLIAPQQRRCFAHHHHQ
jgi:hypothetical protein